MNNFVPTATEEQEQMFNKPSAMLISNTFGQTTTPNQLSLSSLPLISSAQDINNNLASTGINYGPPPSIQPFELLKLNPLPCSQTAALKHAPN